MKRVLITGGAGFIGLHLARCLLEGGATQVVLADNFRRGRRDEDLAKLLERTGAEIREIDLTEAAAFSTLGSGYDEVYHLAAVVGVGPVMARPHEVIRINALATLHLLDWMAAGGGRRLLFASTSEAYAWTQQFHALPIPTPENVPLSLTDLRMARSSYAGSKIFGELAVTQYGLKQGLPFVIVRFHNVYGPRMGYDHVIPELFERMTAGAGSVMVHAPDHRRAFCYVDDAVRLMIELLRSERAAGETFNVGNDREEISIGQLAEKIRDLAGVTVQLHGQPAAHDPITRRCPCMDKARAHFGYEPKVNLDEGLKRTLAWYAQHPRPKTT